MVYVVWHERISQGCLSKCNSEEVSRQIHQGDRI